MSFVIALLACVIPSAILYFWIRKQFIDKPGYKEGCRSSLIGGIICSFPVILTALLFNILGTVLKIKEFSQYLWYIYKCFTMLALAEELWKYLFFLKTLKKTECDCSWYDVTAFMTIVGMGFGILESVVYSFTLNPIEAIIRGVTVGHGVYGYIMGYFYGKACKTGKKGYYWAGFMIPYLMHGLYDFSLTEGLSDVHDIFIFLPVLLVLAEVVILVRMIIFFRKRRNDEMYISSLHLHD